ncbi:MAG: hypothetical protein IPK60_17135 [Sandaracinaceae bacterium]|nr:hypothetical protein [Sandaracinaceae bacterium]
MSTRGAIGEQTRIGPASIRGESLETRLARSLKSSTATQAIVQDPSAHDSQDPSALEGLPPTYGPLPQFGGVVGAPIKNSPINATQVGGAAGAAQNPTATPSQRSNTGPASLNQTGVAGQTNQFNTTPSQAQPNGVPSQTNQFISAPAAQPNAPVGAGAAGAAPGAGATGATPGAGATGATPGAGAAGATTGAATR